MPQEEYTFSKIEEKWKQRWQEQRVFEVDNKSQKPKKYVLDMFPYPSGQGLHVGHPEGYTATDIVSRYYRHKGYDVLHPMGWDSFGLPAENYAIKTGTHPRVTTKENIATFKRQIQSLGFSYDWQREFATSDPEYYRWTQWLFLELYRKGLAYKKEAPVNWCEHCKTVLANEQVIGGLCERCDSQVIQKNLSQWFFKTTAYAEELLEAIDAMDWPESLKITQKNWIGKSEGASITFQIAGAEPKEKLESVDVFTTRPDTLFGVTFLVLAPEHAVVKELQSHITNWDEVVAYQKQASAKSELQRKDLDKEKTGVPLEGVYAVHPATGDKVPVWIADYVLTSYGTGAIMAVPAHDQRDFEFAEKYGIAIKEVILPVFGEPHENEEFRKTITAIVRRSSDGKFLAVKWKKFGWLSLPIGGIDEEETPEEAAVREVFEETGYTVRPVKKLGGEIIMHFFAENKNVWRHRMDQPILLELVTEEQAKRTAEEEEKLDPLWIEGKDLLEKITHPENIIGVQRCLGIETAYDGKGELINSGEYTGMSSTKAAQEITKKFGTTQVQYKLRDWLVSRQRFWGAPIPIVYCAQCANKEAFETTDIDGTSYAIVPVPQDELPVRLPDDVDFNPTGESPLKHSKTFHEVACPACGTKRGEVVRESDTMDTFVCSSWYFLRFTDPLNDIQPFSKEAAAQWMPVDLYVGGMEHAVGHLIYARFITKALRDMGYLTIDEPFTTIRNQGLILGENGEKMSKSRGNVVNPDDIVTAVGADALRMYEMFMGPLEESKPWNTNGAMGVFRFLQKMWRLQENVSATHKDTEQLQRALHKTIYKITHDIEALRFNTAISAMMILLNMCEKEEALSQETFKTCILLLSPFAPFITEELWERMGHDKSIAYEPWPEWDEAYLEEEEVTIGVQFNGKTRGQLTFQKGLSEKEVLALVAQDNGLEKYYQGEPAKVIFVPDKIINLIY